MARRLLTLIIPVAFAATLAGILATSATPASGSPTEPRPIVVPTSQGGFDWGDAAIGAAITLGLVLGVAGVLVLKGDRNDS